MHVRYADSFHLPLLSVCVSLLPLFHASVHDSHCEQDANQSPFSKQLLQSHRKLAPQQPAPPNGQYVDRLFKDGSEQDVRHTPLKGGGEHIVESGVEKHSNMITVLQKGDNAADLKGKDAQHTGPEHAFEPEHAFHLHAQALHAQAHVHGELMTTDQNQTGAPNAVTVYWTHGFMSPSMEPENYTTMCGFPCVQSKYPDDAAYDEADVLVTFPIDATPPKNARGGASLAFSMESMRLYGGEHRDKYDGSSTLDWRSTVPYTLANAGRFAHSIGQVQWRTEPTLDIPWEDRKPAAVFVARSCGRPDDVAGRQDVIAKLVEHGVPVESISDCKPAGTSGEWPADVPRENKLLAVAKYRVYLALENIAEEGYVSEKVTDGLSSGTVPVYYGAPDIDYYVPDSAFINANDYLSDIEGIAGKIKKAIDDKQEWYRYRDWLDETPASWNGGKVDQAFVYNRQFDNAHPDANFALCRICRFGFAHRMGKTWDRKTQQVESKPVIPPNGDPFWETWRESS